MTRGGETTRVKRGVYCLPQYAGQKGQNRQIDAQASEIKTKNSNLSFLSDPSSVSEADGQSGSLGADGSATDAWAAETFDFPDPMVDVYFPQKMEADDD